MNLVRARRATEFEFVSQSTPSNHYDPQHVRRSLLGERRWSYAVESTSSSLIVCPRRKESFTGIRSSCSASIIFDSPTLFPNSLHQTNGVCPPESVCLQNAIAAFEPESGSDEAFQSRNAAPEPVDRRIHSIDSARMKPQADASSSTKTRAKTIRSFNARLNSFAQKGNYLEVLSLIEDVQSGTINISGSLNTYSFTILLKAYCNAGNLAAARKLVDTMHCFDESKRPNRFTYNTLMNAFIRWEDMKGAAELFDLMEMNQNEDIRPDHVTYTTLMKGYAASGDMEAAANLFQRLRDHPDPECRPNQVTYNTMLKGFVAEGDMDAADRLLDQMSREAECRPDIISMNTIIGGYARQENLDRARHYFEQMRSNGIMPNAVTFHALIEVSIRIGDMDYADKLFQATIDDRNPVILSASTYRAIVEAWLRLGDLQKAEFVFCHQTSLIDPASQPNQATCMLMAAAYSQAGMMEKTASLFSRGTNRNRYSLSYDSTPAYFDPRETHLQGNSLRQRSKRESIGSFSSDDFPTLKFNFEQF